MAKEAITPQMEEKVDVQQYELHGDTSAEVAGKAGAAFDQAEAFGQQESGFEGLGAWDTIKAFRRAALYCFLVTFAAATDGYQVSKDTRARWSFPDRSRLV